MLQGIQALETGRITVRLTSEQIEQCRAAEGLSPEGLYEEFDRLDRLMQAARAVSPLPEDADPGPVNELLIRLRIGALT